MSKIEPGRVIHKLLKKKPYTTTTASALQKVPRHVAIIMDGNGRWAKERGLPRSMGHHAGTEAVRGIIRASDDLKIEALTIYAFSTENWKRPEDEVGALMQLLMQYFTSEIDELHEKGVCIRILGDVDRFPPQQREVLVQAMEKTKANTGLKLNIALNYGGRAEILYATKAIAQRVKDGEVRVEDIDDSMFSEALYTHGLPEVDLLIRTSGEERISNFLLWQLAYAEMIFADEYWPDYTQETYLRDLLIYQSRDRRFGGVR